MTRPGKIAGVLALLAALIGSPVMAEDSDTLRMEQRIKELEATVRELRDTLKSREVDSRLTKQEIDILFAASPAWSVRSGK